MEPKQSQNPYMFDPVHAQPDMMDTIRLWHDLCVAMIQEYSSAYMVHKGRGNEVQANYYKGMADGIAASVKHFEGLRINAG